MLIIQIALGVALGFIILALIPLIMDIVEEHYQHLLFILALLVALFGIILGFMLNPETTGKALIAFATILAISTIFGYPGQSKIAKEGKVKEIKTGNWEKKLKRVYIVIISVLVLVFVGAFIFDFLTASQYYDIKIQN